MTTTQVSISSGEGCEEQSVSTCVPTRHPAREVGARNFFVNEYVKTTFEEVQLWDCEESLGLSGQSSGRTFAIFNRSPCHRSQRMMLYKILFHLMPLDSYYGHQHITEPTHEHELVCYPTRRTKLAKIRRNVAHTTSYTGGVDGLNDLSVWIARG